MEPLALVTGASRSASARPSRCTWLARGHHVVAVARTQGALEELDDRIQAAGGAATLAPMDVTDAGAMQHLCRGIHDRWGALPLWGAHGRPCAAARPGGLRRGEGLRPGRRRQRHRAAAPRGLCRALAAGGGRRAGGLLRRRPATRASGGAYLATKAAQRALIESWAGRIDDARRAPRIDLLTPPPDAHGHPRPVPSRRGQERAGRPDRGGGAADGGFRPLAPIPLRRGRDVVGGRLFPSGQNEAALRRRGHEREARHAHPRPLGRRHRRGRRRARGPRASCPRHTPRAPRNIAISSVIRSASDASSPVSTGEMPDTTIEIPSGVVVTT